MLDVVPICLLISILKTFTVYIGHQGEGLPTIQQYYWKSSIIFVFVGVFHFQYMHRSSFCSLHPWKSSSDYLSPPGQLLNPPLQYVTCYSRSEGTADRSQQSEWSLTAPRLDKAYKWTALSGAANAAAFCNSNEVNSMGTNCGSY